MTPAEKLARSRRTLRVLIPVLALGGILLALLATKIPLVPRLLLASIDLIAAATLALVLRGQK